MMQGFIKISIALTSAAFFITFFVIPVFAAWTTSSCKLFEPANGQAFNSGDNFNVVIEVCTSGSGGGYSAPNQYAKYCSGTTCVPLTSISTAGGANPMDTATNPQGCSGSCKGSCQNITFGVNANNLGSFVLGGQCVGNNNVSSNRVNITILGGLSANASFGSNGALGDINTNSSIVFNGTCTVSGGSSNIALYVQDNSSGAWANTTGAAGAFIYANRTSYNLTSVSGTSGSMFFNISVTNKTAEYGLRIQCSGPALAPSWANSTVENNLTLNLPVTDSCTPTANEDWILSCSDNCRINNREYFVRRINVTGSGSVFVAKSNITYTAISIQPGCRFVFNETFKFRRGTMA